MHPSFVQPPRSPLRLTQLPMTRLLLAAALVAAFFLSPSPTAADARFARLSEPGIVAILRHAFAPGTGDPRIVQARRLRQLTRASRPRPISATTPSRVT